MISVGTLSARTGFHIETIRYYEREGVLPKPRRLDNGRRIYAESDVTRLCFVRSARDLGFDLAAVKSLLKLREEPQTACSTAKEIAAEHLNAVELKIERMLLVRDVLRGMCRCRSETVATCRTIKGISQASPN